ncbi:MAG: TetR/AcrR family transcriptional regulator [Candidatus Acidiferrales bacterium]
MSPRTRGKPDSELLAGTVRVIERVGPHRLTLADVARETGLAPATLLQRFGSKRGLLLAVVSQGASGVHDEFARIRAMNRSPLRSIEAVARCMAQMARTPEALANHLAFLEMDLADREFHRLALAHARQFRKEVRTLLDEAVRTGELRKCPTAKLATAVHAMIGGSLLGWAIYREGKADAWILRDLDVLLRPYRRQRS